MNMCSFCEAIIEMAEPYFPNLPARPKKELVNNNKQQVTLLEQICCVYICKFHRQLVRSCHDRVLAVYRELLTDLLCEGRCEGQGYPAC